MGILILLQSKLYQKLKSKKEDTVLFLMTLLTSFMGLFIALHFDKQETQRRELEYVEKLLLVGIEDLEQVKMQNTTFYGGLLDESDSSFTYSKFTDLNPREFPELFEQFLRNDIILKNMSYESLKALKSSQQNMRKLEKVINNGKWPNATIKVNTEMYIKQLNYTIKLVYAELAFLKKEVSKKELLTFHSNFAAELLGLNNIDLKIEHKKETLDWNSFITK
jgi:hypothetical protein